MVTRSGSPLVTRCSHLLSTISVKNKYMHAYPQEFPYRIQNVLECEFYLMEMMDCCLILYHPYRPLTKYAVDIGLDEQIFPLSWSVSLLYYPPSLLYYPPSYDSCITPLVSRFLYYLSYQSGITPLALVSPPLYHPSCITPVPSLLYHPFYDTPLVLPLLYYTILHYLTPPYTYLTPPLLYHTSCITILYRPSRIAPLESPLL